MNVSQLLTQKRQEAGLSQEALAYRTGLSVSTIRRVEQGRREPLAETLALIGRELGIPAEALLEAVLPAPA